MEDDVEFKPYLEQVYEDLKAKCIESGELFEDDQFPACDESLVCFKQLPKGVQWKRPHEFLENPKVLINNGKDNANDMAQGQLGDCWFLAAAAAISNIDKFFKVVVPNDQSFDEGDYHGIFHFRFWRYGEWIDVVIDDYLPVDANNQFIYCYNRRCKNELWCSLLEKAYAKLNNCYEFLISGFTSDALIDMTGGVNEMISLRKVNEEETGTYSEKDPEALWQFLKKCEKFHSLCGSSIGKDNKSKVEEYGLVVGHAYSITKFAEVPTSDEAYGHFSKFRKMISGSESSAVRLIRVRNPWGNDKEWLGPWSDKSDEWTTISQHAKKRLGLVFDNDGEFWMSFEDFIEYFDFLEIVHVNMNAFFKNAVHKKAYEWDYKQYFGSWVSGESAGGSNYKIENFWNNPQYVFNLEDTGALQQLIVALMQIGSREGRADTKGKAAEKPILAFLFKINDNSSNEESDEKDSDAESNDGSPKYTGDQLTYLGYIASNSTREIVGRFNLKSGSYVVIPCLKNANEEAEFLLRIFIEYTE